MTRFYILGILIFSAIGCTTSSNDQDCTSDLCIKQRAYDKVIEVHDEVMPKLSQISDLKGQIEERMNASVDSVAADGWRVLMVDLDAADEAMWVWMRQFNSDLEEEPLDEALEYLQDEQKKIDKVAEMINGSIAKAEKKLGTAN